MPLPQAAEGVPEDFRQLQGIGGRAGEAHLRGGEGEVLPLEEEDEAPGRQVVAPGLDAGRLNVPEELGEEVIRVRRGWAKVFVLLMEK